MSEKFSMIYKEGWDQICGDEVLNHLIDYHDMSALEARGLTHLIEYYAVAAVIAHLNHEVEALTNLRTNVSAEISDMTGDAWIHGAAVAQTLATVSDKTASIAEELQEALDSSLNPPE